MPLAVPSQRTWAVGDIVTAAMMNANVRDAVNFLANPPLAVVYQSVGQSIAAATNTAVNFDATTVDTYTGHSNSVNNSRYTCQAAGWHLCLGNVGWPANATGHRTARIWVNGLAVTADMFVELTNLDATNQVAETASAIVFLNVGDFVQLAVHQNSGGALTPVGAALAVLWVHA